MSQTEPVLAETSAKSPFFPREHHNSQPCQLAMTYCSPFSQFTVKMEVVGLPAEHRAETKSPFSPGWGGDRQEGSGWVVVRTRSNKGMVSG